MATEEFMNRSLRHAFDAEEVMAYLDGELEPTRAAALAGNLEHCAECQSLAKELRLVSGRMLNFEIEPAPTNLGPAVLAENAANRAEMTKAAGSGWSGASRWWELVATRKVWAFGAAFAMVLVVAGVASISELGRLRNPPTELAATDSREPAPASTYKSWLSDESKSQLQSRETYTQQRERSALSSSLAISQPIVAPTPPPPTSGGELAAPESVGPMIVQTASLSIVAKNYDEANAAVQKLDAQAQSGDSRSLSVALRVPAKELEGLLVDLRKLGHVEEESKSNEEVSAEYVLRQGRACERQAPRVRGGG